jgi:tetratricopeptide (TPR) repeat protein
VRARHGDAAAAVETYRRYIAELLPVVGRVSVLVGVAHARLAQALVDLGDLEAARAEYDGALAILDAAEPNERTLAHTRVGYAALLERLGRLDEAEKAYQQALDWNAHSAMPARNFADAYDGLGRIALARKDLERARARFKEGYEVRTMLFGSEHPELFHTELMMARLETAAGNMREAQVHYINAVRLIQNALGDDSKVLVEPLVLAVEFDVLQGENDRVGPTLERAWKIDPARTVKLAAEAAERTKSDVLKAWVAEHGKR